MDKGHIEDTQAAVERVVKLEEELESPGHASVHEEAVASARALLHQWIDRMTGVVVSPGLGRVTLIHPNGRFSTIHSPDLPFLMSPPTTARPQD